MKFNGVTNFQLAFTGDDKTMVSKLMRTATDCRIRFDIGWNEETHGAKQRDLLQKAILDQNNGLVRITLDAVKDQSINFHEAALTMRNNFERLWLRYHSLIEPLLVKNFLSWDACEVDVPSSIFHRKSRDICCTETSNTFVNWKLTSNKEEATKLWSITNATFRKRFEKNRHIEKVRAIVKYFCISDICKIGSNGILRFLLFQKTPSYIFKVDIIKWTITYKWEHIWRKRFFKMVFMYGMLIVFFTTYTVLIAYFGVKLKDESLGVQFSLAIPLILSMLLALNHLMFEYNQVKTYIKDGKRLFPQQEWWGIKHYLMSTWNWIELGTYLLIMFVIPLLHILTCFFDCVVPYLYSIVSCGAILVWIKVST